MALDARENRFLKRRSPTATRTNATAQRSTMKNTTIAERVALANKGQNKFVIEKMTSGWLVIGDVQPLPGYCVFLADPVVPSINDLAEDQRIAYSLDVLRAGDAILEATGALRINYETLCNLDTALHTHLLPRYEDEPPEKRHAPPFVAYSWQEAEAYSAEKHSDLAERIKRALGQK